jgi:hydroxymethylbilane synthase
MQPTISSRPIIFGTRQSRLARWQTDFVISQLKSIFPGIKIRIVTFMTHGDREIERPLPEIGGKGVFTLELEQALREGAIDLAVHSLKDLPIEEAPGVATAAISKREDARDVLVAARAWTLENLPTAARVGTSSLRRTAQLLAARPDLQLLPLRGNVDTRVRKTLAGEYDAIVLAAAGVIRLGLADAIREYLPFETMLPAPGQGALAMQCRADDRDLIAMLAPVDDPDARAEVTAERAFLESVGGGCSAPIAAFARVNGDHIELAAMVAAQDGRQVIRVSGAGKDPRALGFDLGRQALAQGAGELLA